MSRRTIPQQQPPAIIARAKGAQIEQAQGEFGSIYTVTDRDGETRFRTNRKDAATAWLEGYAAGRRDQQYLETDRLCMALGIDAQGDPD